MSGVEKEVDKLGRVVIPIPYREKLGIEARTKVNVSLQGDNIIISPTNRHCALCGKKMKNEKRIRLCDSCIFKVKSEY
ncbi:MAG: AbrB/MazE/SpoVT family DNA-binding domain-containing protein [Clostridia bacterium]|nr:AbrB/MazE/SpoVT family DNA-binding domain-containing protein [Clostridia bacterium]